MSSSTIIKATWKHPRRYSAYLLSSSAHPYRTVSVRYRRHLRVARSFHDSLTAFTNNHRAPSTEARMRLRLHRPASSLAPHEYNDALKNKNSKPSTRRADTQQGPTPSNSIGRKQWSSHRHRIHGTTFPSRELDRCSSPLYAATAESTAEWTPRSSSPLPEPT